MENKYGLNFEEAINCGNMYLDGLQDTMNTIKEQYTNAEELEVVLLGIANDDKSYANLIKEADRLLKEDAYQQYLNQRIINALYVKLINEVLPGDNFEPITDYLESLTEETVLNMVNPEIDRHELLNKHEIFNILGYRSEYYHANDNEKDYLNEDIIIVIKHEVSGSYYELKFSEEDEDLGYVINNYGYATIERVKKPIYTSRIKEPLNIILPKEINAVNIEHMSVRDYPIDLFNENGYFEIPGIIKVSERGDDIDEFYPEGYVEFNRERFEEPNKRQMGGKPVWIFKGDSGAGKTYLSSMLERMNMKIFETDSIKGNEIIDPIKADIIVIGNKHGFKVEYVKEHVANRDDIEFIEVDFNK